MSTIPHDFASSLLNLQRKHERLRRALRYTLAAIAAAAYFAYYFWTGGNAS